MKLMMRKKIVEQEGNAYLNNSSMMKLGFVDVRKIMTTVFWDAECILLIVESLMELRLNL